MVIGDLVVIEALPGALGIVVGHEDGYPDNVIIRWLQAPKIEVIGEELFYLWEFLESLSQIGVPHDLLKKIKQSS